MFSLAVCNTEVFFKTHWQLKCAWYSSFFSCSVWLCRCSWYKFFLFNSLSPTPSCYLEVVWNKLGLTVHVLIQMLCFSATRLSSVSQKSLIYPLIIFLSCSCDLTRKSSLSAGILLLDIITVVWCKFNYLSDFKKKCSTLRWKFVPSVEANMAQKLWTLGTSELCVERSLLPHWKIPGLQLFLAQFQWDPTLSDYSITEAHLWVENFRRHFYSL